MVHLQYPAILPAFLRCLMGLSCVGAIDVPGSCEGKSHSALGKEENYFDFSAEV